MAVTSAPCSMYSSRYENAEWPCVWAPSGFGVGAGLKSCPYAGTFPYVLSWLWTASPICLRLLAHWARAAASRTFCTAGSSRPIRIAMIAMTTRSSISVNADRPGRGVRVMGTNLRG